MKELLDAFALLNVTEKRKGHVLEGGAAAESKSTAMAYAHEFSLARHVLWCDQFVSISINAERNKDWTLHE